MFTRRRAGRQHGFTLIEVLMAMVLLGIGVMMMGPLAVSAIRTVALADRDTRAAATATLYLEDGLVQLRGGVIPGECTNKLLPNGDRVSRSVTISAVGINRTSRLEVKVIPESRGHAERPFTIASNVFHSIQAPTIGGRPCP